MFIRIRSMVLSSGALLMSINASGQNNWSSPTIVTTMPDRGIYVTELAYSAPGTLAIGFVEHYGETTGTLHIRRHANIGVVYSTDRGNSWGSPTILSDSRHMSGDLNIVGGAPQNFHFAWSSGDAMSGFRLHTAHTTDVGATYTSQTLTQNLGALNEGYLFPTIAKCDDSSIMTVTGYRQDEPTKPYRGSIYRSTGNDGNWVPQEIDLPASSSTEDTIVNQAIATEGSDCMIAYLHSYDGSPGRLNKLETMSSADGGLNWSRNDSVTTFPVYGKPLLGNDGYGTWILIWNDQLSPNNPYSPPGNLYMQRSIDLGASWSIPKKIIPYYYYRADDIATDGEGRWIISSGSSVILSDDNGQNWSYPSTLFPGNLFNISYIGDGNWGAIYSSEGYLEPGKIYFSTMQWGDSTVDEWSLY